MFEKKIKKADNRKHHFNDHFYSSERMRNNLFKHSYLSNLQFFVNLYL